jgi:hypothetical protein
MFLQNVALNCLQTLPMHLLAGQMTDRMKLNGRWTVELGTKLVRKITARDSPEAPGDGEGVADGGIAKP